MPKNIFTACKPVHKYGDKCLACTYDRNVYKYYNKLSSEAVSYKSIIYCSYDRSLQLQAKVTFPPTEYKPTEIFYYFYWLFRTK